MADGPNLRSKPTGQLYLPCPTLSALKPIINGSFSMCSLVTFTFALLGNHRLSLLKAGVACNCQGSSFDQENLCSSLFTARRTISSYSCSYQRRAVHRLEIVNIVIVVFPGMGKKKAVKLGLVLMLWGQRPPKHFLREGYTLWPPTAHSPDRQKNYACRPTAVFRLRDSAQGLNDIRINSETYGRATEEPGSMPPAKIWFVDGGPIPLKRKLYSKSWFCFQ